MSFNFKFVSARPITLISSSIADSSRNKDPADSLLSRKSTFSADPLWPDIFLSVPLRFVPVCGTQMRETMSLDAIHRCQHNSLRFQHGEIEMPLQRSDKYASDGKGKLRG